MLYPFKLLVDCHSEIENRKSEIVITLAQKAIVGKPFLTGADFRCNI